jgi:hypothetical protein
MEPFQYRSPSCMPEFYVNPRQLSNTTDSATQSSVTTVTDPPTLTATASTDSQVRLTADQAQFSLHRYHLAQRYSHI